MELENKVSSAQTSPAGKNDCPQRGFLVLRWKLLVEVPNPAGDRGAGENIGWVQATPATYQKKETLS